MFNTRSDIDAASPAERDEFMNYLALSINKWRWNGDDWEQYIDTNTIGRFGFAPEDFPDAPVQPKPEYNPDQRELEQKADEVREERNRLLDASDWTQASDAPVDQQAWADYRQSLRDVPQQSGFPEDVTWPVEPE